MPREKKFFEWDVLQFLKDLFWRDDPLGSPFITFILILLQVILYLGWVPVPWNQEEVCLSPHFVLKKKEYWRLWIAPLEHADEMHLLYNMIALLRLGSSVEKKLGHLKFLYVVLLLTSLASGAYVYLSLQAYKELRVKHFYYDCALGFSSTMFAMKTLANSENESKPYRKFGDIRIWSEYVVWVELLLIELIVPDTSFLAHLAGIIIGYLYRIHALRNVLEWPYNATAACLRVPER